MKTLSGVILQRMLQCSARLVIERFVVRFRVDAILLCVYFSVLFFFFFFLSSIKRGKHMLLDNMSSLKMRGL